MIGQKSTPTKVTERMETKTQTRATMIHHVGLSAANMERTLRFYCDLLGMELLRRSEFENRADFDNILGMKDVKAKSAMLRLGSMHMEVFEFERPRGHTVDLLQPVCNPRIYHLCFEVNDVDREYDRLLAAGVKFHHPPQDFGVGRAVYGRDPDGNVFELVRWAKKTDV